MIASSRSLDEDAFGGRGWGSLVLFTGIVSGFVRVYSKVSC